MTQLLVWKCNTFWTMEHSYLIVSLKSSWLLKYFISLVTWILSFAFYPPLYSNVSTKKYETFHLSCNKLLVYWLVFTGTFLLLVGTCTRSFVTQLLVDYVTEKEIKHCCRVHYYWKNKKCTGGAEFERFCIQNNGFSWFICISKGLGKIVKFFIRSPTNIHRWVLELNIFH